MTRYPTPWQRKKMLWARVISDGVHTMAPEVATGIYTPEELDDTTQTANQTELLPSQPTDQPTQAAKTCSVKESSRKQFS